MRLIFKTTTTHHILFFRVMLTNIIRLRKPKLVFLQWIQHFDF